MSWTEHDTEKFYDEHDSTYRAFWDPDGSLHWGLYEREPAADGSDYLAACFAAKQRLLAAMAGVGPGCHVLDIGCGNGNSALWLAARTGAEVTGIDISGVRVANAQAKAAMHPDLPVQFRRGSAVDLPFAAETFTHIWSQATLYHVHERQRALVEIARVLRDGGVLAFDDLVQPREQVSDLAKAYVYDRLLFGPTYSHASYKEALAQAGLRVVEDDDWSKHLGRSYVALAARAAGGNPELQEAYGKMTHAIRGGDVGWSFFKALRVRDPLAWIYDESGAVCLERKYDAWAPTYEADVGPDYHAIVRTAAHRFAALLPAPDVDLLDIGSGTGLVGEALREAGVARLTGLEPSAGMRCLSERRRVYQRVHAATLEDLACAGGDGFDAALAVGVFTHGHVPLENLALALSLVRSGGILGVVLRDDLASGATFDLVSRQLHARQVGQETIGTFDGVPMRLFAWHRLPDA